MNENTYRLVNNVFGWVAFIVAAIVYCSTIEPTASFWDCPEFISTGYKLEVGHPPGAPFFMLTANLFSQFVSDPTQVARMVNTMSALLSAACILFLFWTITHLVKKLLVNEDNTEDGLTLSKTIAIMGSGMVGALIYTFSDTFWFSAVEGEVYAYSSAFTAVVFWLILKWENRADQPHSDRYLILIAYLTGLSIGVHLLNLLCIPAIVLVWFYKKYPEANVKGSLCALAVSVVLIAAVLYGIVPGIVKVGGWFELLFVNVLHMPFNTGLIIYIICVTVCVIWAVYETYVQKNQKRENISFIASIAMLGIPFYGHGAWAVVIGIIVIALLWLLVAKKFGGIQVFTSRVKNTALLAMLMIMIGYSTYAVIVIRSSANPPMDQNSPEDIFTLGEYLGREQYGDRPLFYGQAYTSQVKLEQHGNLCVPVQSKGAPVYQRKDKASPDEKDSYFVVRTKDKYVYAQNMLFPRMHDAAHRDAYESWMGGVDGYETPYDRCGETVMVKVPTQIENIRFFLSYQCNFMYWRYFMWNFAGRQNDIQGNGELEHGNWLSGIPFIDNLRLGNQDMLPDELKENKGHNVFYCLPLLLGLLGLFWQAYRGRRGIRQFWVVCFLFFMTGLAIVIYLNQTPQQPRERDYAYAGSFYAFAIWCGMGVAAIISWIKRHLKPSMLNCRTLTTVATVVSVVCLLVPIQMASQTWDDHDRSGRYMCRDFGQNYLSTLPENQYPIIYTNGDNDTFPLWYNQDTEEFRTDARVCNLSYIQTDWYIDQMRRPAYDSPSLPITWNRLEYCAGTNDYVEVRPEAKQSLIDLYRQSPEEAKKLFGDEPFELKNILKYWIRNKDDNYHYIPTDTIFMTVDKEAVRKSGMMLATEEIPDKMVISLHGKSILYKGDMMVLEMLANCNWTRPIYVAVTVGSENYLNLGDNTIKEGLASRITPFTTNINGEPVPGVKMVDTKRMYDNLMHKYKFGGLDSGKDLYLDETIMRMCWTHRRLYALLAQQLYFDGENEKAKEVLLYADKHIPASLVPISYHSGSLDEARIYLALGMKKQARDIIECMAENSGQYLRWYISLGQSRILDNQRECNVHFYILQQCVETAKSFSKPLTEKIYNILSNYSSEYNRLGGTFPFSD
ncbi:MAG: DUF2723 domain-containing protein [Prevotella sp.]|nr:DUF2723 domain-containing protein [Candidatus Equicola stercoris]